MTTAVHILTKDHAPTALRGIRAHESKQTGLSRCNLLSAERWRFAPLESKRVCASQAKVAAHVCGSSVCIRSVKLQFDFCHECDFSLVCCSFSSDLVSMRSRNRAVISLRFFLLHTSKQHHLSLCSSSCFSNLTPGLCLNQRDRFRTP